MADSGLLRLGQPRACRPAGSLTEAKANQPTETHMLGDPKTSFKFLWLHIYSTRMSKIFSLENHGLMVKFHGRALKTSQAEIPRPSMEKSP